MTKILNVYNPVYDENGFIFFGEFYWEGADGQGWYMTGDAKNLPRELLDDLLKDAPTPLEKLM